MPHCVSRVCADGVGCTGAPTKVSLRIGAVEVVPIVRKRLSDLAPAFKSGSVFQNELNWTRQERGIATLQIDAIRASARLGEEKQFEVSVGRTTVSPSPRTLV